MKYKLLLKEVILLILVFQIQVSKGQIHEINVLDSEFLQNSGQAARVKFSTGSTQETQVFNEEYGSARSGVGTFKNQDGSTYNSFNSSYPDSFWMRPSEGPAYLFFDDPSFTESLKGDLIIKLQITLNQGALQIYKNNELIKDFPLNGGNFSFISEISALSSDYIKLESPSIAPGGHIRIRSFEILKKDGSHIFSIENSSEGNLGEQIDWIENFVINSLGNTGIGTNNPDSKLTVAGNVHAREVKVTVDAGADFVFNESYQLRTLEETEKFISKNKHLPEIASENEMLENGLQVGKMNIKLLQKVEELTLYMIDMNKRMNQLETENRELKEKVNRLENE